MGWFLIIVGVILGLILLVFGLLCVSLLLGIRRQNRKLNEKLAPVIDAIKSGRQPDSDVIRELATDPLTRSGLYEMLLNAQRPELMPAEYRTQQAIAESDLVFWLDHPHELQSPPDEIQFAQVVSVPTEYGDFDYYLFKFRVEPPHWAADKKWMAGVAGPYPKSSSAYASSATAFSDLEAFDSRTPEEHTMRVHELMAKKGLQRWLREASPGSKQ